MLSGMPCRSELATDRAASHSSEVYTEDSGGFTGRVTDSSRSLCLGLPAGTASSTSNGHAKHPGDDCRLGASNYGYSSANGNGNPNSDGHACPHCHAHPDTRTNADTHLGAYCHAFAHGDPHAYPCPGAATPGPHCDAPTHQHTGTNSHAATAVEVRPFIVAIWPERRDPDPCSGG